MKTLYMLLLFIFGITQTYCQDSTQLKKAPWFVQRFKVSAGLFIPVNNTNIKVGTDGGEGTDIDFEDDLGFEKVSPTFYGDFQWRLSHRSRLDFTYYIVNRGSSYTLDKDIVFGEDTFHINSNVRSYFNTGIYRVSYGYALFAKPKFELGLIGGFHIVGAKAGISFKGDNLNVAANSNFNVTAPIPDFGIWGGYEISKSLAINAEADYLGVTIDNITGRILAYNILLSYRIIEPLHVAVGYTGLNCKIEAERDILNGHFKWGNNGPSLTVTYAFGKKKWLTD